MGNKFSSFNYPIIINSYGRSGSTVLARSIIKSGAKSNSKIFIRIAHPFIYQSCWDLDEAKFEGGYVYKTHDYPPEKKLEKHVRMLYTYANPVDVIISLLHKYEKSGDEWMKRHFKHLKKNYRNVENLINEDYLDLEKHLRCWLHEQRFPIAFIRYEAMWDHQEEICEFVGMPVDLPNYRERAAKSIAKPTIIDQLEDTYSSLINLIEDLDPFFINQTYSDNKADRKR